MIKQYISFNSNQLKSKHIQVSANDISQITFLLDNTHTVYPISEYNQYIKTLKDLMIESVYIYIIS